MIYTNYQRFRYAVKCNRVGQLFCMESNLVLHFERAESYDPNYMVRPDHEISFPFENTRSTLLEEGMVVHQYRNYFFSCIDTVQYSLKDSLRLRYTLKEAAIIMVIYYSSEGNGPISSHISPFIRNENYCCMIQQKEGDYHTEISSGIHKFILLSISPKWILGKATQFPKFQPILENYTQRTETVKYLPKCPLTGNIKKAVHALSKKKYKTEAKLESVLFDFVNDVIGNYHEMLQGHKFLTSFVRRQKIDLLKNLIHENFGTELVNDLSFFTEKLNVSEKDLNSLSHEAFQMSAHQYVIHYRMCQAFKLISFTDKKINAIALEVGYKDTHYFSRAFKAFHKIPPSDVIRFGSVHFRTKNEVDFSAHIDRNSI